MSLSAGETIDDRYCLLELVGRGGMAEVWAAREVAGGREVAVKILRPTVEDSAWVERMQREAQIMSAIQSRHVPALLGSGVWLRRPYLVFERLYGEPLSELLDREGSLTFPETSAILDGILEGLVDAQRVGVIHRDLTPANVYLQETGKEMLVRLIDFGISRYGESGSLLTGKGSTLGSLSFMAPEQSVSPHDVDGRADVYSCGVIAFRCLAGRLPFEAVDPLVVVAMKRQLETPSLAEVTGEAWPAEVERFLRTATARARENRFPSAVEALTAWRALAARTTLAARRRGRESREREVLERTETMVGSPGSRGSEGDK